MKPALTTRLGGAGILVSPKMCLTVTEPSLATSPGFGELQAATSAVPTDKPRRGNSGGTTQLALGEPNR